MFASPPVESITIGNTVLPIVKTQRKTSIGIKHKHHSLELHVPAHLSDSRLRRLLRTHHQWIVSRVDDLSASLVSPWVWQSGQTLEWLGEVYRINLLPSADSAELKQPQCSLLGNELTMFYPAIWNPVSGATEAHFSDQQIKQLNQALQTWYRLQAQRYLDEFLPNYMHAMQAFPSKVVVKTYKSRWGSCNSRGELQFNWRLWQAPAWVVDYVMVHELAHLRHPNHSRDFWQWVGQHYSKTADAKQWLKQHQQALIGFLE